MRFISTRAHGVLDYIMGALLLVAPCLLGFADGTAAQYVPQALGIAMLGASLLTNYELGFARIIPMRVHLFLDIASGALLAVSPWLFGFADRVWVPHLVLGSVEIGAALVTQTRPRTIDATLDAEAPVADRRTS